jgi:hypothetical protein
VASRWRHLGALTAAGLAAWLAYELSWTPSLPPAPAPAADAALAELPRLEVDAPALSSLRATLERPLFDDDRRPNAPDAVAASGPESAAAGKLPPVRLSAVIVAADGSRTALMQPDGQEQPQRVRKGDQVAGWRIDEISDEGVVLNAGAERLVVPLRVFEPQAPKGTTRAPARRPAGDVARRPPPKPAAAEPAAPRSDAEAHAQPAAVPAQQARKDSRPASPARRVPETPSQRNRN